LNVELNLVIRELCSHGLDGRLDVLGRRTIEHELSHASGGQHNDKNRLMTDAQGRCYCVLNVCESGGFIRSWKAGSIGRAKENCNSDPVAEGGLFGDCGRAGVEANEDWLAFAVAARDGPRSIGKSCH